MKANPKFSIIIPLYKETDYFYEAIEKCLELDYPKFEIIVGVDRKIKVSFKDKRIRVLKTGLRRTGPAEKRDIGIVNAKGDYVAFLDDDSYPKHDWLNKSLEVLKSKDVSAVCGPGLTPPSDNFLQKVTGGILSSKFGSGPYYYRFTKAKPRFVDDYPAYNMIISKNVLKKVGGFGTKYYGGEDTALCLKLINAGEKIYYHPDIVVYHHRRKFPFDYVKQVGNVGKHRGYFVKKYPQTSLRPSYFGPALFLLVVFVALAYIVSTNIGISYFILLGFLLFYALVLIESSYKNTLLVNLVLPFAIIVNYYAYGKEFMKGLLFTKKLDR
jgi:GT2 family glycosyltransferase